MLPSLANKHKKDAYQSLELYITAFITGSCVMILELVGTRVVAPYIGTSLIVWTALISVILGSLSLGYWFGGLLADKNPSRKVLSRILVVSGVTVGFIKPIELYIIPGLARLVPDIRLLSLIVSILLFAIPSVLLGMISPFLLKLRLAHLRDAGTVSGRVWAFSTLGSITGTILAGFFLIAVFGHATILYGIAVVLLLLSFVFTPLRKSEHLTIVLIALLSIGVSRISLPTARYPDIDTLYSRVQIVDVPDMRSGRVLRGIKTSPGGYQTLKYIDGMKESVGYISWFKLATHFQKTLDRALVIGGAGYSLPWELFRWKPLISVDVVEIDPGMTRIAYDFFSLTELPNLKIYHEDGRMFLSRDTTKYDALFLDAFGSSYVLPHHLITREAIKEMKDSLRDGGGLYINVVSALSGEKSAVFRSMYATIRTVFPSVYVFSEAVGSDEENIHNLILVGINEYKPYEEFVDSDPTVSTYLAHRYEKEPESGKYFTDSYVPIEFMTFRYLE